MLVGVDRLGVLGNDRLDEPVEHLLVGLDSLALDVERDLVGERI
jgi:hypothetical protein